LVPWIREHNGIRHTVLERGFTGGLLRLVLPSTVDRFSHVSTKCLALSCDRRNALAIMGDPVAEEVAWGSESITGFA
jgi:hypothetical protein